MKVQLVNQKNSKLYLKFTGEQKSRGRKRIYGDEINYDNLEFWTRRFYEY